MNSSTKALVIRLEMERRRLAARRDALRVISEEAEGLLDVVDRAYDSLGECIEVLSEQV